MKFRSSFLLLVILAGTTTARADIVWETDYNSAVSRSRATGKPLFIDFYTSWCGWCKKLDSTIYPDPRVQKLSQSYVMLKLDAEGNGASVARAFQVKSYPTLVFASSQGQMLNFTAGYLQPDDFIRTLQSVLASNGPAFKTPRAASGKTSRSVKSALIRSAIRPQKTRSVSSWRVMPELKHAVQSGNYGGTFLLDGNGTVALDAPPKKVAKAAKSRSKLASSQRAR